MKRSNIIGVCWLKAVALVVFSSLACVVHAASVDAADAKNAAQAWVDGGYSMRKLSAKTVLDVRSVKVGAVDAHVARLSGGGAVILSADDCIDPVIAFSPSSEEALADENGPLWALLSRDLAARMAAATNALPVKKVRAALASASSAAASQTASQRRWAKLLGKSSGGGMRQMTTASLGAVSDVRVAPLVQSRWSQRNNSMYSNWGEPCFNYYTPGNSPCGCVATAMAQLMRFHRYPLSVTPVSRTCRYNGTSASYEMKGGTYDYDGMPLVPEAYSGLSWYAGGATEAQRKAIGKLTYDCGVAMQMAWTSSGSSSGGAAAHGPLKEVFGYANAHTTIYAAGLASATYRERIIHTNLDAGYPVLLAIDGSAGGHEILADGYGYSDSLTYTHLNMGWANAEDVWYALPDIGSEFNVIDGIVYNVFPEESGELVSGRVVDASGNPISGADVGIRVLGSSTDLKTTSTGDSGTFGFVVPAAQSYVVTATYGTGSVAASATTGTSADSQVTLSVGSYSYFSAALSTEVACGNFSCGDLCLSSVAAVEAPVISPAGGLFYPTATVTISCATEGATIRYTLDGSDPTESSAVYTASFTLDDDTTVKARAFKSGFNPSIVVPATFTYDIAQGGPKGDFYSRPIGISGASGSYETVDDAYYTREDGEPWHTMVQKDASHYSYTYDYRSCWFSWTAPGNGTMTFKTKFTYSGIALWTVVAVYSDSANMPSGIGSRLAMDRAEYQGEEAVVTLEVSQGTTYRIVCAALSDDYSGPYTLTWSGELTAAETKGTEVPVPYDWLAKYYPSAGASSYETLAASAGANGLTIWESYLAGLDPTNANSKLQVTIRMDGSTPVVEWNVTNASAQALGYSYKVLGSRVLGADDWTDVLDATHRFFKVVLEK